MVIPDIALNVNSKQIEDVAKVGMTDQITGSAKIALDLAVYNYVEDKIGNINAVLSSFVGGV